MRQWDNGPNLDGTLYDHRANFNSADEQLSVEKIFNSAIASLSPDDRSLPQISNILPLLKRGIGIHHGGLLPILKEVIEILFQEGLIKALFATETFSIGLNMPAKTVVFTNVRKFDGKDFRNLSSGECACCKCLLQVLPDEHPQTSKCLVVLVVVVWMTAVS